MMQPVPLFPTIVYYKECTLDLKNIKKQCYEHKKNFQSDIKSNEGGYRGGDFMCDILAQEILFSIPLLEHKPIQNLQINMWVNINGKGNYNVVHNHGPYKGTVLSGVFYVKCPESCGKIKFYDPRNFLTDAPDMEYYNDGDTYWYFEPSENKLLLFPAWLYHSVDPNQSDEDRISVAFNVSWDTA